MNPRSPFCSVATFAFLLAAAFGCSTTPSVVGPSGGSGGHTASGGAAGATTTAGTGGTLVIIIGTGGGAGAHGDAALDPRSDASDAVIAFCGDGIINQAGEACDDGNTVGADGCTAACDQIEDGWICPAAGQPCVSTTQCGDKRVSGGETCDDGNTADGDGCSGNCTLEKGYFCPVVGAACRVDCGDKVTLGNETCDDGNTKDGDGCDARCQLEPGYVCDAAGLCRKTVCGDGVKEGTEQCDDTKPGAVDVPFDGCFHCLLEPDCSGASCKSACGDGQRFSDEECDDGNLVNGDGCSSSCKTERGFSCGDTPASTLPTTKDIPVVVRDFIGLGRESSPSSTNANYHLDFNRHYGAGHGIFSMVKPALSTNGRPAWNWLPFKTSDITTDTTSDSTPVPTPLATCRCDETAPASSWKSSSETWTAGGDGAPATFNLARPPCSCTDGSTCTCDNTGHLFKDGAVGSSNRRNLSTPANLEQWYTDVKGVNLTLPFTLTLTLTDAVNGTYSNVKSASATAFDPIPASGWIATGAETPSNCGSSGATNVSFTTETHFWFEYKGGEQFAFSGDDDVWVFINKTLVVDLGGLHGKEDGSFTLDPANGSAVSVNSSYYYDGASYSFTQGSNVRLGLVVGQVYEVAMFQAERNQCGSNFGVTLKNFAKPRSICKSTCGDGIVAANEFCDDGSNTSDYNGCGAGCVPAPYCGDGIVQSAHEECDDGLNISAYGGCMPGCKVGPSCGDGRVQAPREECDDGVNKGGYGKCYAGCHYGDHCGDGIVQSAYEECDEGPNNGQGTCLQNCKLNIIP